MILINPGSSYNFIDVRFAMKKDIKIKRFEQFRVSNANGKPTLVDQVVENLGVRLQGCVVRRTSTSTR